MPKTIAWNTMIRTTWTRSMELRSLEYRTARVIMIVDNDDDEKRWKLEFHSIQGLRITTYECASAILHDLGGQSALFEILDSPWKENLGRGGVGFMVKSRHFVVCCYDEIVEILAHDCDVSEVPNQENIPDDER